MSIFGTKALAYDIEVKNSDGMTLYYNYINDGTELAVTYKNYSYYCGDVVIPEEVTYMNRTRKVTSIGNKTFYKCSDLTSVTIPNSVTTIGEESFYKCSSLISVMIPNSVTRIEHFAFKGCNYLTSVTIGNSVTKIGKEAFRDCGITSITIPNSVTNLDNYAFCDCSSLISVTISNSLSNIETGVFSNCTSLNSVTIPNSVMSIGSYAFKGCIGLTSVAIGNNVTKIGKEAFYKCNLTSITIPNSMTSIGDYAFNGYDIPEVISRIDKPFNIETNTFSDNTFYNATLYVPAGTIEKYKEKDGWRKFVYIKESASSSITHIENEEIYELKRYTLDGRVIKNPHRGINIIQMNDGTTKKIFVK